MRPDRNNKPSATLWVALSLPVMWFGLMCGSAAAPGRKPAEWIDALTIALNAPLRITITPYSVKAVLISLLVYAVCVLLYIDSIGNRRPGIEYGSAKWGNAKQICAKYRYRDSFMDRIRKVLKR